MESLRFVACGDRTLLVYLGADIDAEVNRRVHALTRSLQEKNHPAIVEVTPAYHSLMIEFDPVRIRPDQVEEMARSALQTLETATVASRTVEIPVLYGGEMGPDLDSVATHAGIAADEVVRRHSDPLYRVFCLGFSPGFCYLGGLDSSLHTPRLANPRTKVPAGSVAIGGAQTGVYPSATPGGWQIIGRTPVTLFDPYSERPALLEPGDSIRFVPVSAERYQALEAEARLERPPLPQFTEGKTGLKVIQPGLATTLQDLGRRGYQAYGVSLAGAADFLSLMVGNWLLGNRARTAALEITIAGPEVEFTGPLAFSLTGAVVQAELIPAGGGAPRPVPMWTALLASPGDRLRIGTATAGCRSYLCVAGGFDMEPVLGSLSEDLFGKVGPFGRPLKAGDWLPTGLPLHAPAAVAGRTFPTDLRPAYTGSLTVRVTRGPQSDAFSDEAWSTFLAGEYTIGENSDRQGLRLQGPTVAPSGSADIISEPIAPGAIQVPANGQPILLLNNRQTLGGYTKIAVALYPDLTFAAQLRPGDKVRFQEVSLAEAHQIAWSERRRLANMRRLLEREPAVQPVEAMVNLTPPPQPVEAVTPAPVEAPPEPPATPAPTRVFRITVAGITYQAEVEEVTE